jgi:hypothetical protein
LKRVKKREVNKAPPPNLLAEYPISTRRMSDGPNGEMVRWSKGPMVPLFSDGKTVSYPSVSRLGAARVWS